MATRRRVVNGQAAVSSSPEGKAQTRARAREAEAARDALAAALTRAGVQLPAVDVRTPWADDEGDERGERGRPPLLQLGVCSAPVARALAAVIERGAAR